MQWFIDQASAKLKNVPPAVKVEMKCIVPMGHPSECARELGSIEFSAVLVFGVCVDIDYLGIKEHMNFKNHRIFIA